MFAILLFLNLHLLLLAQFESLQELVELFLQQRKPNKIKAIVIPIGVNTILIPSGSKICPNQPELEYKVVSAIPETAVGRAKGKSTIASKLFFPKNVYRTKHQATTSPKLY